MNAHKYSLKIDNGFGYILKDGQPTLCPYQNKLAVPQQSSLGGGMGMAINQYPCSISCPHCNIEIEEDGGGKEYIEISCSQIVKRFVLTEEEPNEEKPTSKLISL